MEYVIISLIVFVISVLFMFFSKMSLRKKVLILSIFILLYGLLSVSYLPKKLVIKDEKSTYIALELGAKEIENVVKKSELINIINNIKIYKGDKHYDYVIQDLTTINVVSEKISLSGKKVESVYFYMLKGYKYGMVYIDQKPYYFLQKELYDAVTKN